MIKSEFICDRCGRSFPMSGENLPKIWYWEVRLAINQGSSYPTKSKSVQWCRECSEETGWLPPQIKPKEFVPEPEKATLESIIRDIVREEIEDLGEE